MIEAEKRIRLQSLLKFSNFSIKDVIEMFKEVNEKEKEDALEQAEELFAKIDDANELPVEALTSDQNIILFCVWLRCKECQKAFEMRTLQKNAYFKPANSRN